MTDIDPIASAPPAVVHCVDCKHFRKVNISAHSDGRCALAPNLDDLIYRQWLVGGTNSPPPDAYYFCTTERGTAGNCGPDGKSFEPLNPKPE